MASRVSMAKRPSQAAPDLRAILERFHEALAVVNVSRIAISASGELCQEECALRHGVAALQVVYNDLDRAEMQLSRTLTAA